MRLLISPKRGVELKIVRLIIEGDQIILHWQAPNFNYYNNLKNGTTLITSEGSQLFSPQNTIFSSGNHPHCQEINLYDFMLILPRLFFYWKFIVLFFNFGESLFSENRCLMKEGYYGNKV